MVCLLFGKSLSILNQCFISRLICNFVSFNFISYVLVYFYNSKEWAWWIMFNRFVEIVNRHNQNIKRYIFKRNVMGRPTTFFFKLIHAQCDNRNIELTVLPTKNIRNIILHKMTKKRRKLSGEAFKILSILYLRPNATCFFNMCSFIYVYIKFDVELVYF